MASNLRIILGISGGIAAYKTPALIRLFRENSVEVKAVCTRAALFLVAPQSLLTVSGYPVYTDEPLRDADMEHIELAKWADYLLVCPATANTIAKITHGIADNLLTSLALGFEGRLVIAPAMNTAMWSNAATQENIAGLARRGAYVLPVDYGKLACGDEGPGRLLDPEIIVAFMLSLSRPKHLGGKKVLIASGPTCEPLDAVRILTSRSSGKMGAALAQAAWLSGAQVTVVSGPTPTPLPSSVRVIPVTTAAEMLAAMEEEFERTDVCIMAASVADFRPAECFPGKKHRDEDASWTVDLVANADIAQRLGGRKKRQFLVGFSLETDDDDARPLEKMKKKNCDMMIVNQTASSLSLDTAQVHILYPNKPVEYLPMGNKKDLALRIMERIAEQMGLTHG